MLLLEILVIIALGKALVDAAVFRNCRNAKHISMTFDEGPIQGNTASILDYLKSNNAKATFHINAKYLTYNFASDLLKRAYDEGHLIGIRFDTQFGSLSGQDDSTILSSLQDSANSISIRIGYTPKFVRLPFSGYNERVIGLVEKSGYIITEPTIDSMDYNFTNPADLVASFGSRLNSTNVGVIAKQIDASAVSVSATNDLLKEIKRRGYTFVTLDTCIGVSSGYKDDSRDDSTANEDDMKGKPSTSPTENISSSASGTISSHTGLILIIATFTVIMLQIY